jgi:hypothetical protein
MKKLVLSCLLMVSVFVCMSVEVKAATASSSQIVNVKTPISINGKPFVAGSPIKSRNGVLLVPLKPFVQQLGLNLVWNSEYKGFRINSYHKVLLIMPGSKLVDVVAVNSGNYIEDEETFSYDFQSEIKRMPVPLTAQGGIQYVPLKWLSQEFGLTLTNGTSGQLHVQGDSIVPTQKHLEEIYEAIKEKVIYDVFLDDFQTFLTYVYNSGIDNNFVVLENQRITSIMGKTIWLYSKANVADLNTNAGITLSRLSEVKVVDEYSPYESIIQYKNKLYIIDNSFADVFFKVDLKKTYKWSPKVWEAIINEEVFVGMTKTQAIYAWGEPDDINSTLDITGEFEQWIYNDYNYLYFSNGILVSIST